MNHRVVVWVRLRAWVESVVPRLSASVALGMLALCSVGCAFEEGSEPVAEVGQNLTFTPVSFPATSATVDVTLPPLTTADRQSLTVGTKNSLSLNDRTTTTGAFATGGPVNGTNDLVIGNLTATGNVTLGARAHTGVLRSGGTVTVGSGSVTGTVLQNQSLPASSAIRFPVSIPAATQNVTAAPNEVATLAPGSYGALVVNGGARLTLTSGTFYFRSFDLEPTAQLVIPSGGVTIFVTGAIIYRGSINDGGNATRLRFFTFGAAQVRADAPFRGLLVASNAPVSVAAGTSAGFFYGTALNDDPSVTFTSISEALSRIAPPLAGTGVTFTATQASPFNGLVANFTDGNQSDTASRFTATINWGDGTATSTGVVGGAAGAFTVSGTHSYASAGNFNVSVSLLNNVTGVAATIASTAHVVPGISATGVTFTAIQSTPFSGLVANVTDTSSADTASSFSASIAWGDGTTSPGFVSGGSGSFTVSGTHSYALLGNFTATISVTHLPSSTTVTATSTAHVIPGLAASGVTFTATPNVAFNGVVATLTDTNLADTGASFTAQVAWGDGTTSAASVAGGSGSFTVVGTHSYAATGTFTVTVTITHTATAISVTATSTAKVQKTLAATGVTLTAIQGVPFTASVATFTDTNLGDTSAAFSTSVAWGDGTSSAGSVAGGAGSFDVTGGHTYAASGTFTLTITIVNSGTGEAATATSTAVVSSQLAAAGVNFTAVSGVPATYTVATVTDANLADTAASFTATIGWGDGSAPSAGEVFDGGTPGVFLVAGSHTYVGAGSHTVTISVANTSGATAGATATATVTVTSFTLAGLDFTASLASPFTGTIAVVSGADTSESASTLTAVIDWGDGATSSGFVVDAGSPGSFLVGGTHQYAGAGTFTATVTVTSSASGGSASTTALGTIGGELSASPFPIDATAGEGFTGLLASLTDANNSDTAADFTVNVSWGDGTAPDVGFAVDGGSPGFFLVFGSHAYASSGTFTATTTITKTSSGEVVTVTTTATVL